MGETGQTYEMMPFMFEDTDKKNSPSHEKMRIQQEKSLKQH